MANLEQKLNLDKNLTGGTPLEGANVQERVADTLEPEDFKLVRESIARVEADLSVDFSKRDKDLIREEIKARGGVIDEGINWIIHTFYSGLVEKTRRSVIGEGLENGLISKGHEENDIPFHDICESFTTKYPTKEFNVFQMNKELRKLIKNVYLSLDK